MFLNHVVELVRMALETGPDLLSLLISSLDKGDVTLSKYPTPRPQPQVNSSNLNSNSNSNRDDEDSSSSHGYTEQQLPQPDFFTDSNKMTIVCSAIREALLPHLRGGFATALNPILCTYAKQSPPLLVDALALIREVSNTTTLSLEQRHQQLSSSKVQGAIKYLAFLAEGSALFDAALGCCDFNMARAVARQCQMDPKAYLPLLKGFEDLGLDPKGMGESKGEKDEFKVQLAGEIGVTWRAARMHFAVAVHLKLHEEAVEWAIMVLTAAGYKSGEIHDVVGEAEGEGMEETVQRIIEAVHSIITKKDGKGAKDVDMFAFSLPRLVRLVRYLTPEEASKGTINPCNDTSHYLGSAQQSYISSNPSPNTNPYINPYLIPNLIFNLNSNPDPNPNPNSPPIERYTLSSKGPT